MLDPKKGVFGRKEIWAYEDLCTQNFPPPCSTGCPVHVDVKGIAQAVLEKDYSKGEKLLRKSLAFPEIICRICDQPCQAGCVRKDFGESIQVAKLERACLDYGRAMKKKPRQLQKKDKKIAIAGGGLMGLSAALFLYEKGYQITIFEKTDRLGGRIWKYVSQGDLEEDAVKKDFAVFDGVNIKICFNNEISSKDELKKLEDEFDGVLDTVFEPERLTNAINPNGIIQLLADGRSAAITIDRKVSNVSLREGRENEGSYESKLYVETKYFQKEEPRHAGSHTPLSEEDSMAEAGRCFRCECMECVKECKFLESQGSYPKKYVREIANNLNITMGLRQSKDMVNSCTFCGLCEKICPYDMNMGDVCLTAKVGLVNRNSMPAAKHDFPINDMLFSNSPAFSLFRHEPGKDSSRYLFYPGCQLAALGPHGVSQAYEYLRERLKGGTGLGLGCCGAPAYWSGRIELFEKVIDDFKSHWQELGKPVLITACPNCSSMFSREIPEIKIQSLWEIYDGDTSLSIEADDVSKEAKGKIAVHDPCTARNDKAVQNHIRSLLKKNGYHIEELEYSGELTKCCGFGGLVSFVSKDIAGQMAASRGGESPLDYVVYCAMCKDHLGRQGKRAVHMMDILSGREGDSNEYITFSRRHENRIKLKEKLLKEQWGESMTAEKEPYESIQVRFADDVEKISDERLILVSDIKKVIYHGESTGSRVYNPKNGHYTAMYQPGLITYWVEYGKENEGSHKDGEDAAYVVYRTYSHRLEINKPIKENEHRKYRI